MKLHKWAKAVQAWIHAVGAKTAYIEPGNPLSAALRLPAGQCVREWVYREFQRPDTGRATER